MHGATMSNLRMKNPPFVSRIDRMTRLLVIYALVQWFNIIANSSDILVSNMELEAKVCGG